MDSKNQRGIALIIVLIVTLLLTVLGLMMTFTSVTEFSTSNQLEKRQLAFGAAEAGLGTLKETLRGTDLTTALAAASSVPQYISYPTPATGTAAYTYFSRNPLSALELMNVDFLNPPAPIGTRTVNGFLTPPTGADLPFEPHSGTTHSACHGAGDHNQCGRYWAKLTDNEDGDGVDEDLDGNLYDDDGPDDAFVDVDGIVYLRIMGIQRLGAGQVSTYGSTVKNSVSIIEVKLERDMSFDLSSPFTVYGPNVNVTFSGNSFNLDGNPHDLNGNQIAGTAVSGFSAINDDPAGGDAGASVVSVLVSLSPVQTDNIVGEGFSPSVQDDTNDIRSSSNEDATNIFDPNWVINLVSKIQFVADNVLPGGSYDGSQISWGTQTEPEITYVDGNLILTGGGSGAGLLVVRGSLEIGGAFDYDGLILVLGGSVWLHGANKSITGGIFTANVVQNADGTYSYETSTVELSGNSNVYFSGDGIKLGYNLLPFKVASWREVLPEIEPQ